MIKPSAQYLTNKKGERISVLLPIKQYQKLLDEIEEFEDIKLYDKAKQKPQSFVTFDEVLKKCNVSIPNLNH